MYTTTITKSGQIGFPKALRDALGVKIGDQVTLDTKRGNVTVSRRMTDDEFLKALDAMDSRTSRPKVDAVDAVRAYRDGKNPRVNAYYQEKYQKVED